MREIKFRGRDICTGEWLYGDLRQRAGCLPSIIRSFCNNGKLDYCETPIHRDSLGQFTGLYDKSDNEIYEGDILCEIATNIKVVVTYEAPMFCYTDNDFGYKFLNLPENFIVIGNIHDNPELLK